MHEGMAMTTTRHDVEQAAHLLGEEERWDRWMKCGVHDWHALPQTESGEHYCPTCLAFWTADGAIKNVPTQPRTRQ